MRLDMRYLGNPSFIALSKGRSLAIVALNAIL